MSPTDPTWVAPRSWRVNGALTDRGYFRDCVKRMTHYLSSLDD